MSKTLNCLVCGKPLADHENICTRCGFQYHSAMGGSWETAFEAQKPRAAYYRTNTFLPQFDLGVTCYYWKDADGTIAPDTTKRLSFGTADKMEGKTLWLDQEFSRLPDEEDLTIEVSVKVPGAAERILPFRVKALTEPRLQRLGLLLDRNLNLTLKLSNDVRTVESNILPLLGG